MKSLPQYIAEEFAPASVGGMPNVGSVTMDNSLPSEIKCKICGESPCSCPESTIAKQIPATTIVI